MAITYVLMQNLRRNLLRTSLTVIAFALPMAVFVAAISFVVTLAELAAKRKDYDSAWIAAQVATGLIGKVELPHFTRPPRS